MSPKRTDRALREVVQGALRQRGRWYVPTTLGGVTVELPLMFRLPAEIFTGALARPESG